MSPPTLFVGEIINIDRKSIKASQCINIFYN